jgi:hypothetical protein
MNWTGASASAYVPTPGGRARRCVAFDARYWSTPECHLTLRPTGPAQRQPPADCGDRGPGALNSGQRQEKWPTACAAWKRVSQTTRWPADHLRPLNQQRRAGSSALSILGNCHADLGNCHTDLGTSGPLVIRVAFHDQPARTHRRPPAFHAAQRNDKASRGPSRATAKTSRERHVGITIPKLVPSDPRVHPERVGACATSCHMSYTTVSMPICHHVRVAIAGLKWLQYSK